MNLTPGSSYGDDLRPASQSHKDLDVSESRSEWVRYVLRLYLQISSTLHTKRIWLASTIPELIMGTDHRFDSTT